MSAKGWKTERLQNLCSLITDGKHGDCRNQDNSGYYFLSAKDVSNGKLSYENARQITKEDFQATNKRTRLEPFDTLLTNSGTIGRMALATDHKLTARTTFQKSVALLKPIREKVLPIFLYYCLTARKSDIVNTASGTTQQNLLLGDLRSFEISIPESMETQRRIADILSALDEKIELNRQTNATLEAIAQAIFKEWFVNFNFPGATGEMIESELGMIPKGWRVGTVADILVLANETMSPGVTPDKLFSHYSIPAFDSGHVPSQELGSTILSNKYKVKSNSILVSKLNPRIPRIWTLKEVNQETSVCSTEFQVLLPQKTHYYSFAANFFSQPSVIDTMKSRSSGTSGSHQRINPQDILDINIVVPTDSLLALYDKIAGNYFHCIINGLEESIILAKIRDSLLPKLMNGEIVI